MEVQCHQSILFSDFFQRCSEANVQRCQGKQLLLDWCLNNMRKQKVGKEVKGKGSFVHSFKKYLLCTSYVPGPGLLSLCWTGKKVVRRELINYREGMGKY